MAAWILVLGLAAIHATAMAVAVRRIRALARRYDTARELLRRAARHCKCGVWQDAAKPAADGPRPAA